MPFGVLQDARNPSPPGTSLLNGAGVEGNTNIVLVPQPSQSPQDPLNWSRLRKEAAFLVIVLGTCGTGVIGPVLVPAFGIIAEVLDITLTQVSLLNGSLVLALGVSAYICTCLAAVYGKRIIFLTTTLILVLSSIWGAASKSYGVLIGARVFQGLGMGGFFALAGTASINDLYFVHQRGFRVGLWNMASIASINMAPIVSAYVVVDLSWPWAFWLLAIFFAVVLALVVFFLPETTYTRDTLDVNAEVSLHAAELQTTRSRSVVSLSKDDLMMKQSEEKSGLATVAVSGVTSPYVPKWKRYIGLTPNGVTSKVAVWRALVTPVTILRHPAVVWSCLMWSVIFSWLIISGSVADQIFGSPPYNMSAIEVGNLVGTAPLIGCILGTGLGGWFCDSVSKFTAARNHGVYEPEFRLWIFVPFVITWIIGAFGLGVALQNELPWIVCGVFLAILAFAVGVGCTGVVAYTNDVCQNRAGESFGVTMVIKSVYAFGLTFMLNDYYARIGPKTFMFTWGGLTVGVTLLTIPLYVYGKIIRAWAQRNSIM